MTKRISRHKPKNKANAKNEESSDQRSLYVEQKTQCQECEHGNSKSTYRPLVGDNGAFLCDQCYKKLYPATAMYDAEDTMFSNITQKIREKRATNQHPEEEECHSCLEHGSFRRCCKRYYCRSCYFESGTCPGCNKNTHRSGVTQSEQRPSKMAVLATWGISISILLLLIALVSATIVNYYTKPNTVWGHVCTGWFPKCEKPVCIDFRSRDLSSGMPTEYEFCTVNETANKVVGQACIIDPELYRWSGELRGFDLCTQDDHEEEYSTSTGTLQGVFVFEDNFDYWSNSTNYTAGSVMMKSAKWAHMKNAEASDICGINSITRAYELEHGDFKTSRKNASLVFSGAIERSAETNDLDVSLGGSVEFYIKLAPVVKNELTTECKAAFDGDVTLSFSINGGVSWESMRNYPVWKYRNENFQFVQENIPYAANTATTRFRWSQSVFDPQRDYWAIDDVRIYSHLNSSFDKSDLYVQKIEERYNETRRLQCQFDTEQCANFPNTQRHGYFRLKAVEIYMTICCAILLCRKFLQECYEWSHADICSPSVEASDENMRTPIIKEFNYSVDRKWQMLACVLLGIPHVLLCALILWHVIQFWEIFYSTDSLSTLYICLSISMDFWTIRKLSTDVFHYWPFNVENKVCIDATKEDGMLIVGADRIFLLDIKHITLFSKEFYTALFLSVCVSGFPLSSAMIFIKQMEINYQGYVMLLHSLGIVSLCRSILGPLWFVEIFLSTKHICTLSGLERDNMGRAFARPSVAHATANSAFLFLAVVAPFLLYSFRRDLSALNIIAIIIATVFLGALSGSLLGLLRGLPVVPKINLTTWPRDGYHFSNSRQSKNSHYMSKVLSGGLNSCELHMMNLTEMELFRSLLSGVVGSDIISKKSPNDKTIKDKD